jgi:hypothetical protein
VEVRDYSVDPAIPLGEVWVRYATGEADLQDTVQAIVDQTRSAGIKARVTAVSTVVLSGVFCVIPDVNGAGPEARERFQREVVKALSGLGIGEPVSMRKLASHVFQIAGLADVAEAQLNCQRLAAPLQTVAADPFLVGAGEQVRPDAGAITVKALKSLAASAATLTAGPATPATSAGAAPATATAAPLVGGAAYAKQVFAAKVLLVYVVEQSHQVYPFVALKNVDAAAGGIAFVGAIAGVHPAKLTVAHVGLGYNV